MAEPVPGISAVPDEANARYFHVVVAGKQTDSIWQLAVFPKYLYFIFYIFIFLYFYILAN